MSDGGTIDVSAKNLTIDSLSDLPINHGNYVKISIQGYDVRTLKGHELSESYSIIRGYGGHIAVEPISDNGTAFHIYLPEFSGMPNLDNEDD